MSKIPSKQIQGIRQQATANATYYVGTTGNDTTGDGLTTGTAFATIQRAIDAIASMDGNGFQATIIPQPGTYAGGAVPASLTGWVRLTIAAAANGTVFVNTTLTLTGKTPITVRWIDFVPIAPATSLVSINATGVDLTIRQCVFSGGDAAFNHVLAADSIIRNVATLAASGTFNSYIKGSNTTVYHSGTASAPSAATFTTFFNLPDGAIVQGVSAPVTPTGTFTGSKYNAAYVGVADALIPGSLAGVRSVQVFDPTLQSIADSTATGVIQRNANETVTLLPVGATGAASLAAADVAAGRAAIGLEKWLNMSGAVITIPLSLVAEADRVNQPCDDVWRRLTFTSYTGLGSIKTQYPGLSGKTLDFKLMVFGTNSMINDEAGYESAGGWNTASNGRLGKMQYRISNDWGAGYNIPTFEAAQRYFEHFGDPFGGSSIYVMPITIPDPESLGSAKYWSVQMRGLRKYPAAPNPAAYSIYAAFLLGVIT